jgi:heptosyltransferase-1
LYAKISDMPRVLIIKTSSLGDVVHSLPVINDIHAHFAETQIDWVVEESFTDIPRMHAGVNKIIPLAIRRWRHKLGNRQTWHEIARFRRAMQTAQYDLVLDIQGLLKSAVIGRLAHGDYHGHDWQSAREPLASLFYSHKHNIPHSEHAITRYRMLAAKALGYGIPITSPDYGIAGSGHLSTTPGLALPATYMVGLHGTSRDSKLWPTQHWITLAQYLSGHGIGLLLPWNNDAERARAHMISARVTQALVLPKLNLNQLATIISKAQAAVGVDTGLSHLAVALKIPTLAIYTDTDPRLTGVYAGVDSVAVNLGGKAHTPDASEVIQALQGLPLGLA